MSHSEVPLKVAVRLRPVVGRENPDQCCLRIQPDKKQIILGKDRAFTFDYIFPPECEQLELFEFLCVPLIEQCFEGYNGTIFAYGQTGSGKTHTIEGDINNLSDMGIIPRSINFIFDTIQASENPQNYSVKISFIEIYKEELHDLLDSENYPFKNLHIREDEKGNTTVVNAKEISCVDAHQVLHYAELGTTLRRTEATQMNERSSRSHCIFTLILERKLSKSAGTDCLSSKIHFVDLAGSERASKTGNLGERFKESIHINTGLLALGNVISALSDNKRKSGHIPYRDAKITRLLKDSLGGNSNTVMITCVPPTFNNFDESLNSLKYANRAKNIRNKPIVNRDSQSMRFEALQSEIMSLKEELEREKSSKSHAPAGDQVDNVNAVGPKVNELEDKLESAAENETRMTEMISVAKQLLELSLATQSKAPETLVAAVQDWKESLLGNNVDLPKVDQMLLSQIDDLKTEVLQLKSDLTLDEQIFNEKAKEMNDMNAKLNEMKANDALILTENNRLKLELNKCRFHIEEQQEIITELQKLLNERENASSAHKQVGVYENQILPLGPQQPRPAKSAPVRKANEIPHFGQGDARNFYTTPSVYSMEKIVQSFRAKSLMLATQWEENDQVLRDDFCDQGDGIVKPVGLIPERINVATAQRPVSNWSAKNMKTSPVKTKNLNDFNSGSLLGLHNQLLQLPEIDSLRASVAYSEDEIKKANGQIKEANKKMRELALAIRLKEEMIKEILKTGREAECTNKTLNKQLPKADSQERDLNLNESAKSASNTGTKKRTAKDTNYINSIQTQVEKKISDLTVELQKMKSQYDHVQKRLKDENEKKCNMEKSLVANNHKVKELETKLDQQQKILKRKSEQVNAMRKSKRHNFSSPNRTSGAVNDVTGGAQNAADVELEKVLERKQILHKMEAELKKREELLQQKEEAMKEKNDIEGRKVRASQVLSGQVLELANKVCELDANIEVITAKGGSNDKLNELSKQRDELLNRRDVLDQQMSLGNVLSEKEQRKLIELEEAVEMLEAAIDFKSDQIQSYQQKIETLHQFTEPNLLAKIYDMEHNGLVSLLTSYFRKVIDLKESEKCLTLQENELMIKIDEQERMIQDLQSTIHQSKVEFDRRTVDIVKEYENKTQMLLKQIQLQNNQKDVDKTVPEDTASASNDGDIGSDGKAPNGSHLSLGVLQVKVKELERELYYYKSTCRDLKKKMREMASNGLSSKQSALQSVSGNDVSGSVNSKYVSTPRMQSKKGMEQDSVRWNFVAANNDGNDIDHHSSDSNQLEKAALCRDFSNSMDVVQCPPSPRKPNSGRQDGSAVLKGSSAKNANKHAMQSNAASARMSRASSVSVTVSKKDLREIPAPFPRQSNAPTDLPTQQQNAIWDSIQKDSVETWGMLRKLCSFRNVSFNL